MLDQSLIALASAAGAAVAAAAGTDAWAALRERVAGVFRRGGTPGSGLVARRLDRTAAEVEGVDPREAERVRILLGASWQTRFEDLLENLGDAERAEVAGQLRDMVTSARRATNAVSAGDGGLAVAGNMDVRAEHGSAAAGVMGDVTLGNPPQPGPEQG
ncbi:hypothetical protein [Streptomyces syringium]|uniref:Uncharacterized protein n=1 Tax=Streptomyces syringium TaxID=76729 RepID=A0ABS4XWP9_9ACTN|nr:hypothetical protein [Streptomyces syringium]MBP2400939.1 hypothetical protein [Streptomyces syringium]